MRISSVSIVIVYLASSLFLVAKAQDENPKCSEVVFDVSHEMQEQYGLNVVHPKVSIWETDSRANNPFPGSYLRSLLMITNFSSEDPSVKKQTFNAANFMESPGIQLRLAKKVMEACPATSTVIFGYYASGKAIDYYRMPSGQIRQGIEISCRSAAENEPFLWGYFSGC